MPDTLRDWSSPPQIAKHLAVRTEKVRHWIDSGELLAVNLAESRSGRPRYRISRQAVEAFLAGRSVVPVIKTTTRRRRRDPRIIEFF